VGDTSDGFPGLAGWGPKSASTVLARYRAIEAIPERGSDWDVSVRGGHALAATLAAERDRALLFKDLATLRVDRSLLRQVDDLRWRGPTAEFATLCDRIDAGGLPGRAERLAAGRGA